MTFADTHIHALFGVDDGARKESDMRAMVDASYADGVRVLCVTPHYHPGYFGHNSERITSAYARLSEYVEEKYPDLELFLGNELRYSPSCAEWLESGECHTLNGTQYVLVDFLERAQFREITDGLDHLLSTGYVPVLGHPERYTALFGKLNVLRDYHDNGVIMQMDTQSPLGGFGLKVRLQSRAMLRERLVDMIGSDAHEVEYRTPVISECYEFIKQKYGSDYAKKLCRKTADRILHDESGKER